MTEEGSVASATGKERRGEGKEVGARQGRKEGNQVDPPGSRRGAGDATLLYVSTSSRGTFYMIIIQVCKGIVPPFLKR